MKLKLSALVGSILSRKLETPEEKGIASVEARVKTSGVRLLENHFEKLDTFEGSSSLRVGFVCVTVWGVWLKIET